MKGMILILLTTLVVVNVSSGCTKMKSPKSETTSLKQRQKPQLKTVIDKYREDIVITQKILEFSQILKSLILVVAKRQKSEKTTKALREIDKLMREKTIVLDKMKIKLRKALKLQRRRKYRQ